MEPGVQKLEKAYSLQRGCGSWHTNSSCNRAGGQSFQNLLLHSRRARFGANLVLEGQIVSVALFLLMGDLGSVNLGSFQILQLSFPHLENGAVIPISQDGLGLNESFQLQEKAVNIVAAKPLERKAMSSLQKVPKITPVSKVAALGCSREG